MSKSPFQGLMKAGGNLPAGGGFRLALGLGALGVGASTLAYSSIFTVEGGHKAIIFSRWSGILPQVYGEGWHLLIPGLHIPHVFNVRTRPTSIPSLTGSKDLQMVNITLRVLTKPKWEKLPQIYKKLGHDYDQRVLPSIVNEVLKGVVARFNAAQLITQRELVSGMIQDRLRERAADFYIDLDDVSITHLGFGREYTAAVEAKQVAQQEAERAKFIVEKAQQDKRGIIIRAEGDAQSAKMISEAIQSNPYYLELKTIEAARDIARSLANSQNKVRSDVCGLRLLYRSVHDLCFPGCSNEATSVYDTCGRGFNWRAGAGSGCFRPPRSTLSNKSALHAHNEFIGTALDSGAHWPPVCNVVADVWKCAHRCGSSLRLRGVSSASCTHVRHRTRALLHGGVLVRYIIAAPGRSFTDHRC